MSTEHSIYRIDKLKFLDNKKRGVSMHGPSDYYAQISAWARSGSDGAHYKKYCEGDHDLIIGLIVDAVGCSSRNNSKEIIRVENQNETGLHGFSGFTIITPKQRKEIASMLNKYKTPETKKWARTISKIDMKKYDIVVEEC